MTLLVNECCYQRPCLLSLDESVTLVNSAAESSLITSYNGIGYMPSWRIRKGTAICWRMFGIISTGAVNTESTFRFKLGGITVATSVGTLPVNLTNMGWDGYFEAVFRSAGPNGQVYGEGRTIISIATPVGDAKIRRISSVAPITIDTTNDLSVDVTYQWTTASTSNSGTCNILVVQTNT